MARTLAQVDARLTTEITNRAAADKVLAERIAALEVRVKALEDAGAPEPPPPPPPPTGTTISQSIVDGSTIKGKVVWVALVDPAPARVEFRVDDVTRHTETAPPYQFGGDPAGLLDTTTLTNGSHKFTATAFDGAGVVVGGIAATATVANDVTVPPPPPPPPSGFPAFLSRPSLSARGGSTTDWAVYDSPTDLVITNQSIQGLGKGKRAIVIRNPRGTLTLTDLDFADVGECILVQGGTNIRVTVERCRVKGILGPSKTPTGARTQNLANFVQFDNTRMAGRMGDNRIIVASSIGGDTEDVFSITGASGGIDANNWLYIEDNQIDGTGSVSTSGSGIALSDGQGGYSWGRRNRLLNPGQVGMFIASGGPCKITDNVIYGRNHPNSNQPWYVSLYGSVLPHDVEVINNKTDWINKAGQKVGGYRGQVGANVVTSPNDWQTPIDPATLKVAL